MKVLGYKVYDIHKFDICEQFFIQMEVSYIIY